MGNIYLEDTYISILKYIYIFKDSTKIFSNDHNCHISAVVVASFLESPIQGIKGAIVRAFSCSLYLKMRRQK